MDSLFIPAGCTGSVRLSTQCKYRQRFLWIRLDVFWLDMTFLNFQFVSESDPYATKAKEKLGWEPKTSFSQLVSLMVKNDLELESNHSGR